MQTLHLPPGMTAAEAEIFFDGQDLKIIHNQKVFTWDEMPSEVRFWLITELTADTAALKLFFESGQSKIENMLYQYAKCRFGGYNLTADLTITGAEVGHEHWPCGCGANGNCCLEPLFRNNMRVDGGVLTARQLSIIQQLALGSPGKNISSQLCISQQTLDKEKQKVFAILGVQTTAQIVAWAGQQNIL